MRLHHEIRAAYIGIGNRALLNPNLGAGITFRDVTVQEHRGKINCVPFVPLCKCYFFPVGVPHLFIEVYAPAVYTDTVNSEALPR